MMIASGSGDARDSLSPRCNSPHWFLQIPLRKIISSLQNWLASRNTSGTPQNLIFILCRKITVRNTGYTWQRERKARSQHPSCNQQTRWRAGPV
jgi:hypothetical protein